MFSFDFVAAVSMTFDEDDKVFAISWCLVNSRHAKSQYHIILENEAFFDLIRRGTSAFIFLKERMPFP